MKLKGSFSSNKLWPKHFLTETAEISAMRELAYELENGDIAIKIGRFRVGTISDVVLSVDNKTIEFNLHFDESKFDVWTLV